MKIGLDGRSITNTPTGVGIYVLSILNYFLRKKIKCVIFVENISKPISDIKNPNLEVIKINPNRFLERHEKRYEWEEKRLPKYIVNSGIELYHATDSAGIPSNLEIPTVLTVHDLIPFIIPDLPDRDPYQFKFYKIRIKQAVNLANKIIAISNNTKNDLEKILKVSSDKIKVIYQGVFSYNRFSYKMGEKIKRKFGIRERYIIYNGGLAERKNVDKIIQAFALLKDEYKNDLQLVIMGARGNKLLVQKIKEIIKKNKLQKQVILIKDFISNEEKSILIQGSLLLIFISSYEGFGLPILEGLEAHVPVIASDIPIFKEIANNAIYYIKNPSDLNSIASGIKKILQNKELKNKLIEKGKKIVKKYSWDNTARETLDIYQELLKKG